jgi:hypothetical protein
MVEIQRFELIFVSSQQNHGNKSNTHFFNARDWAGIQLLKRILQLFVIGGVTVDNLLLPADGSLNNS